MNFLGVAPADKKTGELMTSVPFAGGRFLQRVAKG
jgi:hypothetical protein